MSTVGTVEKALAAALYADGDEGLDTGASLLAADPATDGELRQRGEEFVRRAWERGWQPADVVRLVRRELDEPHQRLAAELITGESGRYEHLAPRWTAQLAELAQQPYRADRFSYATTLLELYRLLVRLPAIEAVGPVPGTPFSAGPSPDEPRMLTRIRALLAKAEATGFPQEAEALTAKAQELMARHSVDEAVLAARTHRTDAPAACRIGVDAPYETAKAILLDAVASANRCRAVWNSAFGFSTVVGFDADLEGVELLYTSLLVQGTAAMTRAEAGQRAGGRKRTKTFRQSFLMAYASRLGERLATATDQVTSASAEDLLPVLVARDVAVTGRAEQMFPETTTTRVRGVSDEAGWVHGRAAADSARMARDTERGRGQLPS
ncbi:DUF2786 domain-containing protein [Streptomyces sp. NBC_01142]|uniref:DUF2786 domain-containing protein n=1 Tax=Streptomyces sp. NBC_01142 TaxID=2975865 RepID=UPI002250CB90|nr:DUF2786 domain-containing protein [Streptomyces sp. NBC_01142]MCX4818417.1 DUF2786 domain-containing protein [Streptomyces sp. NBC_01142]